MAGYERWQSVRHVMPMRAPRTMWCRDREHTAKAAAETEEQALVVQLVLYLQEANYKVALASRFAGVVTEFENSS